MEPHTSTLFEILQTAPPQRALWERLGIDVSRHQDQSLAEVCRNLGLDLPTVVRLLAALDETPQNSPAIIAELMTLEELCAYLEHRQERLLAELTGLDTLTRRAAEESGGTRLLKIRATFLSFRSEFAAHLHEEAAELFPDLRRPPKPVGDRDRAAQRSRLARLAREHSQADEALSELGSLADGKSSPGTMSSALREISAAISRLHQIVHEEIYAENRILFPRALSHWSTP